MVRSFTKSILDHLEGENKASALHEFLFGKACEGPEDFNNLPDVRLFLLDSFMEKQGGKYDPGKLEDVYAQAIKAYESGQLSISEIKDMHTLIDEINSEYKAKIEAIERK